MDSETPPSNAENIRWGFPNSVHIIVENGFHETLPASEVQDIVVDFFKGQDVSARRITFARPLFLSLEQARTQILAPSNPIGAELSNGDHALGSRFDLGRTATV